MYVLVDMEWIKNSRGDHWPTQLAAMRVDCAWNTVDSFSILFRPKDLTFQQWGHMAFSGWSRAQFQHGEGLHSALNAFQQWLLPDDTLCWWHQEACDLYNRFAKSAHITHSVRHTVFLCGHIYSFLAGQKGAGGSPYQICAARGIEASMPAHCSENDILTVQALLKGIHFPQTCLEPSPKDWSRDRAAQRGSAVFPLLYDPESQLLHRSDCAHLPEDRMLPAYTSFKQPLLRKYRPCACCRDDFYKALKERNTDIISRAEYNFLFSKYSMVFHTRTCPHVLRTFDLLGAIRYETCLKSGRRPCKHCRPEPVKPSVTLPNPVMRKPQIKRCLTRDEKKAIGRFKRAKAERRQALTRSDLTDAERKTVMALSQPGLAFWAGRGYQTFHRRNCPQITGLTQLRGFPRYQDAVRAGYTPCRHCKPSPKQDVVFSIPITNQERTGETTDTLIQLCTAHGLPFEYDGRYFTLQTMAGKWRIDTNMKPVHLEHINLVSGFGDPQKYHIQPRLFLSLKDTFDYIMQHDGRLIEALVRPDSSEKNGAP